MFPNNQSKPKQIKTNALSNSGRLKKITNKDQRTVSQSKPSYHNINPKQKSKAHKTKQQFQIHSKSKQKNTHTKVINYQYYTNQKRQQKPKRKYELQKQVKKCKSNSKCSQINQVQNKRLEKDSTKYKNDKQIQKINKICLPDFRSVIAFDGKIVKVPPKNYADSAYHNYTSLSGYQDAGSQPQFNNQILKDNKKKIRSKQKSKNSDSKSGHKKKQKISHKHYKSQQHIIVQNDFQKNNLYVQQTQVSPFKQKDYERPEKFDFQQIYELIQQDLKACAEIKISADLSQNRKQCMKFMSEICGEIPLRRQTFYLALSIFDRAISTKMTIQNYKLLALVSLALSMKLEQARMADQFVHILGVVNSGKQSYLDSISSCKSSSKPKSITQRSQKSINANYINKKWKPTKININHQNIRKISISGISKIMKKYNCSKFGRQQFVKLEQKVTIYLRFRLWRIQAIFWADLLTCLWDQHIVTSQHSLHQNSHLFFRSSVSLTNIAYLYQIIEMAYRNQAVYNFPSIYIVLSAIYLLVRITKQNTQNGYDFYRQSLATSTNILFVDKTGINQIYWLFLDKIKIQMVQILSCCQFISSFLRPSILKNQISKISNQELKQTVDHSLALHQFNPDLYQNLP